MVRAFGHAVPLDKAPNPAPQPPAEPQTNQTVLLPKTRPSRFGVVVLLGASVMALFWIGAGAAFLWGSLGPQGLDALGDLCP